MIAGPHRRRAARFVSSALAIAILASLLPGVINGHAGAPRAAADGSNCGVDSGRLTPDYEEQAMLDQTNAYRVAHGLPALRLSYSLSLNALWKSNDMSARRYSTIHDDAFRSWDQRFRDCGYTMPGATFAENLAAGHASGVATLQQWKDSPHHDENLLDPDFSAVGIKRVQASPGDPYGWYWTMDLGSDLDQELSATPRQTQ